MLHGLLAAAGAVKGYLASAPLALTIAAIGDKACSKRAIRCQLRHTAFNRASVDSCRRVERASSGRDG